MAESLARAGQPRIAALRPVHSLIAAAAAAVVLLTWSGVRVSRAETQRRTELRRADATLAAFAELRGRYEPAVAAESIAWRRTWMELRELGVAGDERLALTQRVARAAELAGLRDVKVLIADPDTTGQQARLVTEGVRSKSAPFSLLVECRGGLQEVVTFLGDLPLSVEPTRLGLVRQDGRRPHRISLAVYELTFSNGVPPGWSSVERDHNGTGSGSRPGG